MGFSPSHPRVSVAQEASNKVLQEGGAKENFSHIGISPGCFLCLLEHLEHLLTLSLTQLLDQEEAVPPACDPESVTHGYVTIKVGVGRLYILVVAYLVGSQMPQVLGLGGARNNACPPT